MQWPCRLSLALAWPGHDILVEPPDRHRRTRFIPLDRCLVSSTANTWIFESGEDVVGGWQQVRIGDEEGSGWRPYRALVF